MYVAYVKANPKAKQLLYEIYRMGPFPFTPIVSDNNISSKQISAFTKVLTKIAKEAMGRKLLAEF